MNLDPRSLLRGDRPAANWPLDEGTRRSNLPGILVRAVTALILGTLLWYFVTSQENPEAQATFRNVPVAVINVATNLRVSPSLEAVDVQASAPQQLLRPLTVANFRAVVDMAGRDAGTYDLPLKIEAPEGVTILSVNNQSAGSSELQVQAVLQASKAISLTVRTEGTPQIGYNVQPLQVATDTVTVSGPAATIAQVINAEVVVDVGGKSTTVAGQVAPVALDGQGQPIAGVSFSPAAVAVTASVSLGINYKTIPLKPSVRGEPASGYRVEEIKITPNTATILGEPDVLGRIAFLETEPLDIDGRDSSIAVQQRLVLTSGVSLLRVEGASEDNTAQVEVVIKPIQSRLNLPVVLTYTGLAPGYSVQLNPRQVNLSLSGDLRAVQNLDPSNVVASLDLRGLSEGVSTLKPGVKLPPGLTLLAVDPVSVEVVLTALPTATPTTTPSPIPSLPATTTPLPSSTAAATSAPFPFTTPLPSAAPDLSSTTVPPPTASTTSVRPLGVPLETGFTGRLERWSIAGRMV